jgi:outer membrane protein assembly factor BamA
LGARRTLAAAACLATGCLALAVGVAAEPARTIQSIQFRGNTRLDSAQLARLAGLKSGDADSREGIGAARDRIVAAYRAQGSDVDVSVVIALPDATHTAVTFLIDERGTGGTPRGARIGLPPIPPPATRQ